MERPNGVVAEVTSILVSAGLLITGLLFLGRWGVYEFVRPTGDADRETVVAAFEAAYFAVSMVATLGALLWYAYARKNGVVERADTGRRREWALLFVGVLLASAAAAAILFSQPITSALLGYALLVVTSALIYFLPTALFAPASFKYSPPLAAPLQGLFFRRRAA